MASQKRIASSATKVFKFEDQPIVWTASGSLFVIEETATQLKELETDIGKKVDAAAAFATPNLKEIRAALFGHIAGTMKGCYSQALPYGLEQSEDGAHPFSTDFLLAGYANGVPYLLEIARDAEMNWHTEEGFYAIGSGGEFASVAQALMRHYLDQGPLPLQYGMQLAYRTIETACEVSSRYVRIPVQIAVADENGARIVTADERDRVKTSVEGWKQIERDALWGRVPAAGATDLEKPPTFGDAQMEAQGSPIVPVQSTGSLDDLAGGAAEPSV